MGCVEDGSDDDNDNGGRGGEQRRRAGGRGPIRKGAEVRISIHHIPPAIHIDLSQPSSSLFRTLPQPARHTPSLLTTPITSPFGNTFPHPSSLISPIFRQSLTTLTTLTPLSLHVCHGPSLLPSKVYRGHTSHDSGAAKRLAQHVPRRSPHNDVAHNKMKYNKKNTMLTHSLLYAPSPRPMGSAQRKKNISISLEFCCGHRQPVPPRRQVAFLCPQVTDLSFPSECIPGQHCTSVHALHLRGCAPQGHSPSQVMLYPTVFSARCDHRKASKRIQI